MDLAADGVAAQAGVCVRRRQDIGTSDSERGLGAGRHVYGRLDLLDPPALRTFRRSPWALTQKPTGSTLAPVDHSGRWPSPPNASPSRVVTLLLHAHTHSWLPRTRFSCVGDCSSHAACSFFSLLRAQVLALPPFGRDYAKSLRFRHSLVPERSPCSLTLRTPLRAPSADQPPPTARCL